MRLGVFGMLIAFYVISIIVRPVAAFSTSNLIGSVDPGHTFGQVGKQNLLRFAFDTDVTEIPFAGVQGVHGGTCLVLSLRKKVLASNL